MATRQTLRRAAHMSDFNRTSCNSHVHAGADLATEATQPPPRLAHNPTAGQGALSDLATGSMSPAHARQMGQEMATQNKKPVPHWPHNASWVQAAAQGGNCHPGPKATTTSPPSGQGAGPKGDNNSSHRQPSSYQTPRLNVPFKVRRRRSNDEPSEK